MRKQVAWAIERLRGREGYTIDPALSARDLLSEVARRGRSLVRAQWTLVGVPGGRLRFCEPGVRIWGRHSCRVGRGVVIEREAQLHCVGMRGVDIGEGVTIGRFASLEVTGVLWAIGEGISIGRRSSVGDYSFIGGAGGVWIGERVLMGQHVSLHSEDHNFGDTGMPIQAQGVQRLPIRIGDDCWIGAGSIILGGVHLGDGCVVAAGSVVTKSFDPGSVIAGVPAKVIRLRSSG